MERWIQTCRRELLDRTLIWNERHLLHALREFETLNTGRTALFGRQLRFDRFPIPTPGRLEPHRSTSVDMIDSVAC
ncbi:hypothetical protein ACWDRB_54910 [Nonomuraea sp. NPDC003707]